ncbi:MAG: mechanosensitive ion channel [Acidobacteria bacterium]|nr:MAG: mechanosensitive ion channel [Acidobacteriota bacterium]
MKRCARVLALGFLFLALLSPGSALPQDQETSESRLEITEVQRLQEQTLTHVDLEEDLRSRIQTLYDEALGFLQSRVNREAEKTRFEREQADIDLQVESNRAESGLADPLSSADLPEYRSVERAEGALERERSRLEAYRSALREVESLAEEQAGARNEISRRLGALDQQIESIGDELRAARQRNTHPDLKLAIRTRLVAQREAALASIDTLRAERGLLDSRGTLLPLKIDLAQQRVARTERLEKRIQTVARGLRRREAESSLRSLRVLAEGIGEKWDRMARIASETEDLAESMWGPDGVQARSEDTAMALLDIRKHLGDLGRISDLTRRKFAAFRYSGNVRRWWPEFPTGFPTREDINEILLRLDRVIPEVQYDQIQLEQLRSRTRERENEILDKLRIAPQEKAGPELQRQVANLLTARRDILDDLIRANGRYSSRLVEFRSVSRNFLNQEAQIIAFIFERGLWVRSVPRPNIPMPGDIGRGFLWLVSYENLSEIARTAWNNLLAPSKTVLAYLILLGVALGARPWSRRQLKLLAEKVAMPATDSFRATLQALLHTVLLSSLLPLALILGSELTVQSSPSSHLAATTTALYYLAWIAALLCFNRFLFASRGLAVAHFGIQEAIARPIRRTLQRAEFYFLPLAFVAIQFASAGLRIVNSEELQVQNNALGRIVFVVGMLVLGSVLVRLVPLKRSPRSRLPGQIPSGPRPVHLCTYLIIALATYLPALLAIFGFYITGYLLGYQMLRSLTVLVAVVLLGNLLLRWRSAGRVEAPGTTAPTEEEAAHTEQALVVEAQIGKLFRFVVILIGVVGLYGIWADALPMLQIVKRVQIWPQVTLIRSAEMPAPGSFDMTTTPDTGNKPVEEAADETGTALKIPGLPGVGSVGSAEADKTTILTLWNLIAALLAGAITLGLVRSVPGLIELILQARPSIEMGSRLATSTLVRYTILILGVSISFGLLGISWSKVQWLAAALTFGLGFGLQEIVANFVSGLILLVERPIRVGDVVTIGTLMGKVSKIQIRATTIKLWDLSEMIVPNKEFITTKLVNWTLSDSKRRLTIPLRVAYGTDLQKVKDVLLEVACAHPLVLKNPKPYTNLEDFGDDSVHFELRCFVEFGHGLQAKDELQMAIDAAFKKSGIEFAIPKLNIQVPADFKK